MPEDQRKKQYEVAMTFKAKPKKCWKIINVWKYRVKLAVLDIKNKSTMYHYRNFNVSVTINDNYLRNKPLLKLGIPDS